MLIERERGREREKERERKRKREERGACDVTVIIAHDYIAL